MRKVTQQKASHFSFHIAVTAHRLAGCRCASVSRFLKSSQVVLIFVMDFCVAALISLSLEYSGRVAFMLIFRCLEIS